MGRAVAAGLGARRFDDRARADRSLGGAAGGARRPLARDRRVRPVRPNPQVLLPPRRRVGLLSAAKERLIEQRLTAEDEELTPTMKLKRKLVQQKYAPQIEARYV